MSKSLAIAIRIINVDINNLWFTITNFSDCPPGAGWTERYGCLACAAGRFSSDRTNTCTPCSAGTYSGGDTDKCTRCPPGFFSLSGARSCTPCPSGTTSDYGASSCGQLCRKGSYAPLNPLAPCIKCSPGSYSNVIDSKKCLKCIAGTSSKEGASTCLNCPRGKISRAGELCIKCPAGTFSKEEGSTKCTECKFPTGSQKGAYRCNTCAAGSAAVDNKTACKLCGKGYYSKRFAETCEDCPPLTHSGVNATECFPYIWYSCNYTTAINARQLLLWLPSPTFPQSEHPSHLHFNLTFPFFAVCLSRFPHPFLIDAVHSSSKNHVLIHNTLPHIISVILDIYVASWKLLKKWQQIKLD